MKFRPFNLPVCSAAGMITAIIIGCIVAGCATGPGVKPADATSENTNPPSAPAGPVEIQKSLTGAELYAVNCNRCHPERMPIERNPAEWETIMTHMRVRANLPAEQARVILKYLQENSGN